MFKCEICGNQTENASEIKRIDGKVLRVAHMCDDCKKRISNGLKQIRLNNAKEEF